MKRRNVSKESTQHRLGTQNGCSVNVNVHDGDNEITPMKTGLFLCLFCPKQYFFFLENIPHYLINSFSKYLLNSCYVLGTVLDAGDKTVKQTQKMPAFTEFII